MSEHSQAWQRGYDSAGSSCPNPACVAKHGAAMPDQHLSQEQAEAAVLALDRPKEQP